MKKIDFVSTLLVCYLARLLILGAGLGDAIALSALVGLYGFQHFLKYKTQPDINADVKTVIETMSKELDDVKKTVAVFKLGNNLRNR